MMNGNKQKKYNNPVLATITGIRDLFKKHETVGVLSPGDRLDGKTVFIDGASSGLGFAIATDVARRGAKVIMACRSGIPQKGQKIIAITGNNDVHMLPVDLSDLDSIRSMVTVLKSRYGIPDTIILNAGIVPKKSRQTKQGLEEMFVVNYLAKFYFIQLLWQDLKSATNNDKGKRRIIFVTSESHRNPEKFEWEIFGKYREYGIKKTMELYGYYKLSLVTFAVELSRRLNPDGAVNCSVFAMCPGPVNTNIARDAPKIFHPLLKIVFSIFFRSPGKAAVPVVYLAASKDEEGKPFDYLFLMSRKDPDAKALDPANGSRLWSLSGSLLSRF